MFLIRSLLIVTITCLSLSAQAEDDSDPRNCNALLGGFVIERPASHLFSYRNQTSIQHLLGLEEIAKIRASSAQEPVMIFESNDTQRYKLAFDRRKITDIAATQEFRVSDLVFGDMDMTISHQLYRRSSSPNTENLAWDFVESETRLTGLLRYMLRPERLAVLGRILTGYPSLADVEKLPILNELKRLFGEKIQYALAERSLLLAGTDPKLSLEIRFAKKNRENPAVRLERLFVSAQHRSAIVDAEIHFSNAAIHEVAGRLTQERERDSEKELKRAHEILRREKLEAEFIHGVYRNGQQDFEIDPTRVKGDRVQFTISKSKVPKVLYLHGVAYEVVDRQGGSITAKTRDGEILLGTYQPRSVRQVNGHEIELLDVELTLNRAHLN